MKAMSIIGIIWFSLSMLCSVIGLSKGDMDALEGVAIFGLLTIMYALAYAIVGLVYSIQRNNTK